MPCSSCGTLADGVALALLSGSLGVAVPTRTTQGGGLGDVGPVATRVCWALAGATPRLAVLRQELSDGEDVWGAEARRCTACKLVHVLSSAGA
mmetsp:Transcript_33371/g.95599  ORF Transcript_33371/g.95599 Transcript_33371/m.95599 type:complete len:93 (-) Transcript_33371:1889-2167(-)